MESAEEKNDADHVPFGGIFGKSVIVRILEQFVTDPDFSYSVSDLADFAGCSIPAAKQALDQLVKINLIRKQNKNEKRPIYMINRNSNRFVALTLLSYAVGDDNYSTSIMLDAARELVNSVGQPNSTAVTMSTNPTLASVLEGSYYLPEDRSPSGSQIMKGGWSNQ
ncbi:MAG: hypothetical protein QXU18_13485 [Thermoplasmatales archaeon]